MTKPRKELLQIHVPKEVKDFYKGKPDECRQALVCYMRFLQGLEYK